MAKNRGNSLSNFLSDRFSTEWKLLSETEGFLSHTPDFPSYEQQFKHWRSRLQDRSIDDTELDAIRSEIVSVRKELRIRGYDLSLGLQRLRVDGFRNDDAMAEGFRRVVLCFCDPEVFFLTGAANHVEISENLLNTLTRKRLLNRPEVHYLWYLRTAKGLTLSGAATERAPDFRRLEERAEANPMKLLSALKGLY
jgi:hypothetical protein